MYKTSIEQGVYCAMKQGLTNKKEIPEHTIWKFPKISPKR